MILKAKEASSSVLSCLDSTRRQGRVHSSYSRTVNILCEDMTWLSLHPPGVPLHPFCVRIDMTKARLRKGPFLTVSPPETATVSRSVIDLGNGKIRIRLGDARAWDCRLDPSIQGEESASGNALEVIDGLLSRLPLASPFLKVVAGGEASGSPAYDSTQSVIHARVAAVVDSIETTWRQRCVGPLLQAMKQVIGLGFGLTPSGDDFLIGFLGASYFFAHADEFRKVVFASMPPLIHRTSLPSFFMLKAALKGLYSLPLSELFRALEDGGADRVRLATNHLTEIGATSGQDVLAGVLSWFHISSTCGAADAAHCS